MEQLRQKAHEKLLTPLVVRKAMRLPPEERFFFQLWRDAERTEQTPEGIAFKVSNHPAIKLVGGKIVYGLNKPLLLVASNLSAKQRIAIARHEMREWLRGGGDLEHAGRRVDAHYAARRADNPRIVREIEKKRGVWFDKGSRTGKY